MLGCKSLLFLITVLFSSYRDYTHYQFLRDLAALHHFNFFFHLNLLILNLMKTNIFFLNYMIKLIAVRRDIITCGNPNQIKGARGFTPGCILYTLRPTPLVGFGYRIHFL